MLVNIVTLFTALVVPSSCGVLRRAFTGPVVNGSVSAFVASNSTGFNSPGWQTIPSSQQKPDNQFNGPGSWRQGMAPDSTDIGPDIYNAKPIDIPFRRLQQGKMMYFRNNELNQPGALTDYWAPGHNDFANQSACGIPDNAFYNSKVAIHPYWLKFVPDEFKPNPLNRFCMQDVCINYIRNDWTNDMISKVTDICCTDPNDPSCCATPNDIKIDRKKALVLYGFSGKEVTSVPELSGNSYPEPVNWIFSKCWAEAIVQPIYADNWWSQPAVMPNNENGWQGRQDSAQWQNNQDAYKAKGWATYPMGGYMDHTVQAITDWSASDPTPAWEPVAGGRGYGIESMNGGGSGGNGTGAAVLAPPGVNSGSSGSATN